MATPSSRLCSASGRVSVTQNVVAPNTSALMRLAGAVEEGVRGQAGRTSGAGVGRVPAQRRLRAGTAVPSEAPFGLSGSSTSSTEAQQGSLEVLGRHTPPRPALAPPCIRCTNSNAGAALPGPLKAASQLQPGLSLEVLGLHAPPALRQRRVQALQLLAHRLRTGTMQSRDEQAAA